MARSYNKSSGDRVRSDFGPAQDFNSSAEGKLRDADLKVKQLSQAWDKNPTDENRVKFEKAVDERTAISKQLQDEVASDISKSSQIKQALDKYGVHSFGEMQDKKSAIKVAQERLKLATRLMDGLLENTDISTGEGRKKYLEQVDKTEAAKAQYRQARDDWFTSQRTNESTLNRRGRELTQDALQMEGVGYQNRTPNFTLSQEDNKKARQNISQALINFREERRNVDSKYPPI